MEETLQHETTPQCFGLGPFLVSAIISRDFPQVQAVVVMTALIFVTVNLLIDVIYRLIDPRIGNKDA